MIIVLCITFGHDPSDVEAALESAIFVSRRRDDLRVIAVDDCSGRTPLVSGVESFSTPSRRGFPAVVHYVIDELFPECSRVVLINPDASLRENDLLRLMDSGADVAVPTIVGSDSTVSNVRQVTTAAWELKNLAFGERYRGARIPISSGDQVIQSPPYAPSGAVIAIDATLLRRVPLRPEFFWLEFSDWVQRQPTPLEIVVQSGTAEHVGASTSVKYPWSVAASQARAKFQYVQQYGTPFLRAALIPALCVKAVRFAIKQRSLRAAVYLMRGATGHRDWRIQK